MILTFANLGRGVGVGEFRRNAARVRKGPRRRGMVCLAELDEADHPDEHRIIRGMWGPTYTYVGWDTHVPIIVPARFRVTHEKVQPASPGMPRQSPSRQIVSVQLHHRFRPGLPPLVVMNAHWPRRVPALESRRDSVMRTAQQQVMFWRERGRSVLFACDSNGYDMSLLHPKARRIGGQGIDWIGWVPHPNGLQVEVVDRGVVDLTIDGHDAPWVKLRLSKP